VLRLWCLALGREAGQPQPHFTEEESDMAKVLRCGDLMPGCSAVMEGKDVAEVMAKGAEHAKKDHGLAAIPPDMIAKVQAAIKDK
jgi:predicted small metal-binding protein